MTLEIFTGVLIAIGAAELIALAGGVVQLVVEIKAGLWRLGKGGAR